MPFNSTGKVFEGMANNPDQEKLYSRAAAFFKITGLWRSDTPSRWLEPYVYVSRFNVLFFFGWLFIASVLSGCYLYVIAGEMDRALDWGTFSLCYIVMQYKFTLLIRSETNIRRIIEKLEIFSSRYPDKSEVNKSIRTSERLIVIGSVLVGGACMLYCTYPVIVYYKKLLPIKTMITFGFNVFQSPIYELYSIYQILGTMSHTIIAMTFDMTYVGFLLTSAAIVRNLNTTMMKNLSEEELSSEEKHNLLIFYIKEHIEIFDFLNELRKLFLGSNILHFSYNYFTAGCTMMQVSRQPIGSIRFFSMISGCSSIVFTLCTFCEAGQVLSNEMQKFWENLYFTDWYKQPVPFRKTLAFALHSTQKDYYMVAGNLLTLSRETEKKIIQAIFTYYTFLLRLNT